MLKPTSMIWTIPDSQDVAVRMLELAICHLFSTRHCTVLATLRPPSSSASRFQLMTRTN